MIPLPDKSRLIEEQDNDVLLAMCVFGEARGEPTEGKIAVAHVVANRKKVGGWFGASWSSVILKPFQFSCFLRSDPNREKMLNPLATDPRKVWEECYAVAVGVMSGVLPDPVQGATHYYSGMKMPLWASRLTSVAAIGRHKFYKEG